MSRFKKLVSALLFAVLTLSPLLAMPRPASANTISPYALPSIYASSSVFSVKANGTTIPVVNYTGDYDYAHFSMSPGTTTIEVTLLGQSSIGSYTISPRKLGITGSVSGNKLTFSIPNDEYLIIKIAGARALVLIADPLETDVPASSGAGIYNVASAPYNANGNGTGLTTAAFQNAINDAANYAGGQGIVYVPAGVYLVGNLELKSDVAVYLQAGAVLRGTGVKSDYTMHWHKDSKDLDITWWIYTQAGATNVKLYGRGTLDGNGRYSKNTGKFGNNIIVPIATSYFTVDGLIIRDSGSWAVTPARSNDLTFKNMKLLNRFELDIGENDGIDVNESQNVLVQHGIGIGLDDPYTTKAWDETTDIALGWPGSPEMVQNVTFDDLISWTYCYGFKIGKGMRQSQSGVTFKNSVVYDASVGIGVHHKYGSGTLSNAVFENIDIEKLSFTNDNNRTWAFFVVQNADGFGGGPVNGLTVRDITVRDKGTTAGKLRGHSSAASINGITFERVYMPGSAVPAQNLFEMNITDRAFHAPVTILPTQIPEPAVQTNVLDNPGFETGNDSGWSQYSNVGSAYQVQYGGTIYGNYKLVHTSSAAFKQKTYQTVSVPNGNYTASVKLRSTGGQNALHLYAKGYGSSAELQAVAGGAAFSSWTELTIPNIPVTNGQVELGIWTDGNAGNWAAFDDFVLTRNYVNNPGFETGTATGWSQYSTVGSAQTVQFGGTNGGSYKLAYEYASAYKQKTYQTITVPNGTYKASVWIRSTGGQNALHLYAKGYGGAEMQAFAGGAALPNWTLLTIDNIPVTSGTIELGIWADANANNFAAMDDFILIRKP
ncbi:glycosyl hydrolase family 28 protein [Cohnella sp. GCM10027633]|uniref:glycosyl hydrolase family 28 protein n=1 Tax=unclassified Cohnella TaxID=2636738 RepID=UPI003631E58D